MVFTCIRKGINTSTHMLCIISVSILYSKWFPWELGYGYDRTTQGVLTLKGITESQLPDYLKTTNITRGAKSLSVFMQSILGHYTPIVENYSKVFHSLDDILDWN